jgi:hypothetical protein
MPESSYFNLENEEVLKVLREIKESPELTQREIATRLGSASGKPISSSSPWSAGVLSRQATSRIPTTKFHICMF